MEPYVRRLEEVQLTVDILDGYNEAVRGRCIDLIQRINRAKNVMKELWNDLLQLNRTNEESKVLLDQLNTIKQKLLLKKNEGLQVPQLRFPLCSSPVGQLASMTISETPHQPAARSRSHSSRRPRSNIAAASRPTQNLAKVGGASGEETNLEIPRMRVPRCISPVEQVTFMAVRGTPHQSTGAPPNSSQCATPRPRPNLDLAISYVGNEEFANISSYMRGRLTLTNINEFVDTYNTALNEKYNLIKKPRKGKNRADLEQCTEWKEQEKVFLKGEYFCTAKDIDKLAGVKIGQKKNQNILTILRHVKRIREERNGVDNDCVSCRMVGGCTCLGVGIYFGVVSRQLKGYNRIGMMVLGTCFGMIGVARLIGINPFKKKEIT